MNRLKTAHKLVLIIQDKHMLSELPAPIAQVVERPLRDREVAGSVHGRAIPKA